MFRHQALITCKRQLKSLEPLSFSLMGESESGAKVDDKENGLTDYQYSRKLFLKPAPSGVCSPPSQMPLSSVAPELHHTELKSSSSDQKITHCHVGVRRASLLPPPWRRWGHPANLTVIELCDTDTSEQRHLHPGQCRRRRWWWCCRRRWWPWWPPSLPNALSWSPGQCRHCCRPLILTALQLPSLVSSWYLCLV